MKRLLLLPLLCLAQAGLAADRTVTDGTGRAVTLSDAPARVIVMHDALLAVPILDLGGRVIGSYGRNDAGESLSALDFIDEVLGPRPAGEKPLGVGPVGNPDLEKMRALHPDLIIGTEYNLPAVEDFAAIAPTYLQNTGTGRVHGIDTQAALAQLLGLEAAFAARKGDYLDEVIRLREAFDPAQAQQSYLTVIIHDQLKLVGEMSGVVQAMEDLGYTRGEVETTGEQNGPGSNFAVPLSPEVFVRLNPDLLVLMNSYTGGDRDEAAIRARLDRIAPGWDRFLKPAREGRILFLDSAKVTTPSVASAEHTLAAYEAWRDTRQ